MTREPAKRSYAESKLFTWRAAFTAPNSPMPKTMRHVMLQLSLHMDEYGESCYPTIQELMARTGLSNRSVIDQIKGAVEHGWLEVEEHGYGGQKWRNHQYRPLIPDEFIPMRWRDFVAEQKIKDERQIDDPLSESYPQEAESELYKNRPAGEPPSPPQAEGGEPPSPRFSEGGELNNTKVVKEVHSSSSKPLYKKKEILNTDTAGPPTDPPIVDNFARDDYVDKVVRWLMAETGVQRQSLELDEHHEIYREWFARGVTRVHLGPALASACKMLRRNEAPPDVVEYLHRALSTIDVPEPQPVELSGIEKVKLEEVSRKKLAKDPGANAAKNQSRAQLAAAGLILAEAES